MQQPPFIEIANTFGAPVYVYDAQVITAQYDRLKRAFQQVPNLRFHYAVKANSNLSVLKLMRRFRHGFNRRGSAWTLSRCGP
jgi:diaminopimelate decarboxylase